MERQRKMEESWVHPAGRRQLYEQQRYPDTAKEQIKAGQA
jgi:hypothetical protein